MATAFLATALAFAALPDLDGAWAEPIVTGGAPAVTPGGGGRPSRPEARRPPHPTRSPAQPDGSQAGRGGLAADEQRSPRDPFAAMGGRSPFCSAGHLDARERAHCRASAALSHPYEINRYGWDIHIDTGGDNIDGNFYAAVQILALLCWTGLTYLLKGVLLILEWAFSLDLLSDTLAVVRGAIQRLHRNVLGEPWFLAAISAAGLWGIYRGFVQRRHVQAAGGLAATVALMVCALLIINKPGDTVGYASKLSNEAALAMVGGASSGSLERPQASFGRATSRLFDNLVLRPWCALEFGDVEFCLASPRRAVPADRVPEGDDIRAGWQSARTVGDWWLRYEANGKGDDVDQRKRIYESWRDSGGRLQDAVRIQKQGGTVTRIALLGLVCVGLLGAILLLGWLGLRLLGYGVLAVLLLLFAPVAFLAPALGDSGRATFLAWGKRLLGALVAKAIYGAFLAVVLVASGALAEAYSLGWFAAWGLQIVFWWSVFLKRNNLLEFVTAPLPEGARHTASGGLMRTLQGAYYGGATARMAKSGLRTATSPVARPAAGAIGVLRDRRQAGEAATKTVAEQTLRSRGREQLEERQRQARELVDRDERTRGELDQVGHALRKYNEYAAIARARDEAAPEPTESEQALLVRRRELEHQRPDPAAVRSARELLRHADVNRARTGEPITQRDEEAWIERRRHAQQRGERIEEDERKQLAAAPPGSGGRELRAARATLNPAALRRARTDQLAANRQERRAQRRRAGVRPPKR